MDGLSGRGKAIRSLEAFSTGGGAGGREKIREDCGSHHHDEDAKEGHQQRPAPCANLWLDLSRSFYRYPWIHQDPVGTYRFGDILDGLFPQKLVPERKLGLDVLEGGLGDADPTGVRQGFQARRDVHPVTVDAVSLLDHIPQVDPDAELHSPVLGQLGVAGFDLLLHRHPALDRIHHTGKLGQDIIPGRSHHPPPVLLDEDEQDLLVGFEGR